MSDEKDKHITGNSTATGKMVVTQASTCRSTVFISKTENWLMHKILVIRNDGTKCEFIADSFDLRAARAALNLFADAEGWDK